MFLYKKVIILLADMLAAHYSIMVMCGTKADLGFDFRPLRCHVTTLGKLFTHTCRSH